MANKSIFPIINHIDDVLPCIEGVESIVVGKKESYTSIHYAFLDPYAFPDPRRDHSSFTRTRHECRGLKFDNNGKIIARPYH